MKKTLVAALCILFGLLSAPAFPEEQLLPAHRTWLEDVSPIITKIEREVFMKLKTDAEREKFIQFFWRQRDPLPDTKENEFTKEYMERVRFADQNFGRSSFKRGSQTERGSFYLILGKPLERNFFTTHSELWPMELWFYKGEEPYGLPAYFYLIFYQPQGMGDYRLYYPGIEGPEKLVIPGVGARSVTRASAIQVIKKSSSELAGAAQSYLPGETPLGSASFSSDSIIAAARSLPEKKFSDAYARSYMNYKDFVETEYADNFINAGAKVRLFSTAGQPFLHWSIEPDKMSFAQRGEEFYAGFEFLVRMEDFKGNLILENTEEIPVSLTAAQYKAHERRRFAFQDILPVIPGNFRFFFLLKNKTGKDFTSFETTVSVPGEGIGLRLSSLLLFHAQEPVPTGQRMNLKAFTFDGVQYVVGAKNEFLPQESLGAYVQAEGLKEAAADPQAVLRLELHSLDDGSLVRDQKVPLAEVQGRTGGGTVFGPFALANVKPGYYSAEVSVVSGGKTLASEKDNFILLSQSYPVLPWAYAKVHSPFPSPEQLRLLATEHFMARDYEKARGLLDRALKLKEDAPTRLLLGKSLFALNRFQDSLATIFPLYEATKDREAAKVIALDYTGLKDWTTALIYLDKLMAEATEIGVLNLAAECHLNLG
ncbi:MAG: GWxTD domain-containing protein, partial [Candidatus Aminicenantes bacterium]|nr:GWxTD domain-containing protein [Candidatus Aminicenantes bacterium]